MKRVSFADRLVACALVGYALGFAAWETVDRANAAPSCTQACSTTPGACYGDDSSACFMFTRCLNCGSGAVGTTWYNAPNGTTTGSSMISYPSMHCYQTIPCIAAIVVSNTTCDAGIIYDDCAPYLFLTCTYCGSGSGTDHDVTGCQDDGCPAEG